HALYEAKPSEKVRQIMQIGTGPSQTDIATRARRPRRALLILAGAIVAGSAISAAAVRAESMDDEAGGPGGPGMHGRRIEKILDRVNATPAQRAQIRAAWDGLRPQINGLR